MKLIFCCVKQVHGTCFIRERETGTWYMFHLKLSAESDFSPPPQAVRSNKAPPSNIIVFFIIIIVCWGKGTKKVGSEKRKVKNILDSSTFLGKAPCAH